MFRDTILWVSDTLQAGVPKRLEDAGYAVLLVRVTEALAVIFVNRSIDAVVVNAASSSERDSLMLVRGLRAIRRDVPIFVITGGDELGTQLSSIEGCVTVGEDPAAIVPQLHAAVLRPAV